jgi:predicted RecB family nuclease
MRLIEGQHVYSPSDVIQFLESPFASWIQRQHLEDPGSVVPDPPDALQVVLSRRGQEHERAHLASLHAQGMDVLTVEHDGARDTTQQALADRREVIYQGFLEAGPFQGYADFLRLERAGGYSIWDTKLARQPKPYFIIQLCCYAEMLEAMTGQRPDMIGVVLGTGEERAFRVSDFFHYYCRIRDAFLNLMAGFPGAGPPFPVVSANNGRWQGTAERWLTERDHLSQVANITRSQIEKLTGTGVSTMSDLAARQPARVRGIGEEVLKRLHQQAHLQVASIGQAKPAYEMLLPPAENPGLGLAALPPASPLDVYFDMEGFPAAEDWLDYLFGALYLDGGQPTFRDWWAHDEQQERQAFEDFMDWAYERWQRDPTMHIYHYAPYETSALKRLMGKYGSREDRVDDLLRARVFVDLYAVVRRSLVVGEPAYSLKNLEHLYMDRRAGDITDAGASVLFYDAWCESGEPDQWQASPLLKSIRDYNEVDCRSTWKLAEWLRERQRELQVTYLPGTADLDETEEARPGSPERAARQRLAAAMLDGLPPRIPDESGAAQRHRNQELLAWLLEFHRRAEKPMWWLYFERQQMTVEELWEDLDCLAGIRADGGGIPEKQSHVFAYTFDPEQDTKLAEGKDVAFVPDIGFRAKIHSFDPEGRLTIKVSNRKLKGACLDHLPTEISLIPYEHVPAEVIEASIERTARAFADSGALQPALVDFLSRSNPRLTVGGGGPLRHAGETNVEAATRVALALDSSCLCIQGPPGTGKTYTAAQVIVALLRAGKSVGISSNGHKAILNLMKAVCETAPGEIRATKVGGDEDDPVIEAHPEIRWVQGGEGAEGSYLGEMVGGTAWFFSRLGMAGVLDYLFVDEAGQVSVANLVGMAPSARNLVLLGDQMQLGQPIQGTHPGESGKSILEYYLGGYATVPPDRGLFIETTWRLHPGICQFISNAVYEGRLEPEAHTVNRVVQVPRKQSRWIAQDAGMVFVPVEHAGNVQGSDEEVEVIRQIVAELAGRQLTNEEGVVAGSVDPTRHILFVAPYNLQVRRLRAALPEGCRVGSVDKFQGQEAPIVIVSMCASPGEFGSRGLQFVLDKNRLNVAISRAQSLAIVVGDPRLIEAACGSVEDMRRLNLYCWIQVAGGNPSTQAPAG